KPDAKPENYGSTAIDIDRFVAVVGEGVAEHNARLGRLSPTVKGGSFDEAFAKSYATAPIRRATAEQRRLWLMGQEVRKLHAGHGRLTLHGNSYWSDWMSELAGTKIVARFDPEHLHDAVSLYALDGRYLGEAACEVAAGFFDASSAQAAARRKGQINRAQKRLAKALAPLSAKDIARGLEETSAPEPET
ncbi:Mu transposase C-terminal domain-containing protein, partial [Profundibacterium mesophilum]